MPEVADVDDVGVALAAGRRAEEVAAFIASLPPRVEDAPWGWTTLPGSSVLVPHEAPTMAGGPTPVCNACGRVQIPITKAFCRTCTTAIALATGGAP